MGIDIKELALLATSLGKAYFDLVKSIPTDEVDAFGWVSNISLFLMIAADIDGFNLNRDEEALLLLYLSSANAAQLESKSSGKHIDVFKTVKKDADRLASDIVLRKRSTRAKNIQELAGAISDVIWQSPREPGTKLVAINQAVESKKDLFK